MSHEEARRDAERSFGKLTANQEQGYELAARGGWNFWQ